MHQYRYSELFSTAPLLLSTKICVIIPVKNEESSIQDLLISLNEQVDLQGNKANQNLFEILILANNCTDHTVDIINEFKKNKSSLNLHLENIFLEPPQANVGYVRKILMDIAYTRLMKNGGGLMITTDGDTVVAKDWLWQNNFEILEGADAVGGRIFLKEDEYHGLDPKLANVYKKDEEYQLLTAELESVIMQNYDFKKGNHHQHFNGSFAVTTDCYQKSGGIPPVQHLEDCAFYERLQAIDAKVRHSNKVTVRTSARCIGRTDIGLAQQLNMWKNMNNNKIELLVESSESIIYRLNLKKQLAGLWEKRGFLDESVQTELQNIASQIQLEYNMIPNFTNYTYFGEWFQEIKNLNECSWTERFPAADISEVILNLKSILKTYSS